MANRLFPVPEALDVVALIIQSPAAIAVGQVCRIVVLKGTRGHGVEVAAGTVVETGGCVTGPAGVGEGVKTDVTVSTVVAVEEGVELGAVVGGSPCTKNRPLTMYSSPTNSCTL
jgi:hypothetical protein